MSSVVDRATPPLEVTSTVSSTEPPLGMVILGSITHLIVRGYELTFCFYGLAMPRVAIINVNINN